MTIRRHARHGRMRFRGILRFHAPSISDEERRRREFLAAYNAAYAALRADPEAWARELAERAELDGTLADGLEEAY